MGQNNCPNNVEFKVDVGVFEFDAPCRCAELEQQNAELEKALSICAGWLALFAMPGTGKVEKINIIEDCKKKAKGEG